MAEPARTTGDRLPWLSEVPKAAPAPVTRRRWPRLPMLAFVLGVMFALVVVGAYWLGSRPIAPKTAEPSERPGMTAQVDTSAQAQAQSERQSQEPAAVPDDGGVTETENDVPVPVPAPAHDAATLRRSAEASPVTTAPVRPLFRDRPRPLPRRRAASQPRIALVPVALQPVVRGRIIQTGAFTSRQEAEQAWQVMIKKWPYLATKPRLISPIEVRSSDGRSTQMFRVQMATASQAQSVVICQRLTVVKQSCVVVY